MSDPTPTPWTPDEVARLRHLVEVDGLTIARAALRLGRTYASCRDQALRQGIQSRYRGRPPRPGVSLTVRVPEAVAAALAAVAADAGTDPSAVAVGVLTDWAAGGAR
jgi:hypothetical protein